MGSGIYVGMSGAVAQEHALDVVANNLANTNTAGFRAGRLSFEESLTQSQQMVQVDLAATGFDKTPGIVRTTDNPLDVALVGDGYLAVETRQGLRFTRAGALRIDDQGALVTMDGSRVMGVDKEPIYAPPDVFDVYIENDGTVVGEGQELGRMAVVSLDPASIAREGSSLYTGRVVGGRPDVEFLSGSLEQANFNAVRGMVDLVEISRLHDAQHRALEAYKQIEQRAARDLGRGR